MMPRWEGKKYETLIKRLEISVGNSHRSAGPRPPTLEEDRELFLIFLQFYVYDLRFKAWGPTTFLAELQTLSQTTNLYNFLSFWGHQQTKNFENGTNMSAN